MPTIAIIAPSAYAPNPDNVLRAVARLQERGWTVKNLVDLQSKCLRFSDNDEARLAQLNQAADDPDVDVVLALRGGYGLSRILDNIDFDRMANSGKLFVGFSDFTPFHLGLFAKTGKISFAGPMIYEDLGSEELHEFSFQQLKQCLSHDNYRFSTEVEGNPEIQVKGTFWGGNLAMLVHLLGTRFMPVINDGILFIEDVNENPYRVERMLLQLHYAGILSRQKALVLGHFTNYRSSEYDNGYDFDSMLAFIRSKTSVPIITGLPFGHCPNKVTLPIGAEVVVTSNAREIKFEFGHHPHLTRNSV